MRTTNRLKMSKRRKTRLGGKVNPYYTINPRTVYYPYLKTPTSVKSLVQEGITNLESVVPTTIPGYALALATIASAPLASKAIEKYEQSALTKRIRNAEEEARLAVQRMALESRNKNREDHDLIEQKYMLENERQKYTTKISSKNTPINELAKSKNSLDKINKELRDLKTMKPTRFDNAALAIKSYIKIIRGSKNIRPEIYEKFGKLIPYLKGRVLELIDNRTSSGRDDKHMNNTIADLSKVLYDDGELKQRIAISDNATLRMMMIGLGIVDQKLLDELLIGK